MGLDQSAARRGHDADVHTAAAGATLLLVPPDTRPPTLAFPRALAEAAHATVRVPPAEALPRAQHPGDTRALAAWLGREAPGADVLIVCLETLCLGGMIPARRVDTPLAEARAALALLRDLTRRSPRLRVHAHGVVVRVAHDDDPIEEKPYYGEFGPALRAYSEAADRAELARLAASGPDDGTASGAAAALAEARGRVPAEVLADWLATRERNHALHLEALELLADGTLEHLYLTLDDTSPHGLAAIDRRRLEARADALGVWDRFDLYPGADEVPATAVARALGRRGARVAVRYSAPGGAAATTRYEDRPLGALVEAHLRAAGCVDVAGEAEADWVLAVNGPARAQAERQPDHASVDTPARNLPAFVDAVARTLAAGRPVALADVAYPNGAEQRLMQLLEPRVALARLAGYAAWNTAGNSLGAAIAMATLAPLVSDRGAWLALLFDRLVDDHLYQGRVRGEVADALAADDPFDLGERVAEAEALVEARIRPLAHDLWRRHFTAEGYALHWEHARLAWPRLFTGVFPFTLREERTA